MTTVEAAVEQPGRRAWLIVLFCAAYLSFQVFMIVRGHFAESKQFAFWMFPESTYFHATLTRVLTDGREVATSRGAWAVRTASGKVEYSWGDFVQGHLLGQLGSRERSKGTFDDTLMYFQAALDYVADRIPEDRVTEQLLLTIAYQRAGEAPETVSLFSKPRSGLERNAR